MIDTSTLQDRWEFGCTEWVEYAAGLGVSLFTGSGLDLGSYEWGFSEEYTHIPDRLLAGREKAGYHLMIRNGRASGGPNLPDECLALPGFHVAIDWALIAHSSYFPFNVEGRQQRASDHAALRQGLEADGVRFVWNRPGYSRKEIHGEASGAALVEGLPECPACGSTDHERAACPVWPPGIGEVLGTNKDKRKRLLRSPELENFPETEWGVPIYSAMTGEEKARFGQLLR
jgi:hypothetical protein